MAEPDRGLEIIRRPRVIVEPIRGDHEPIIPCFEPIIYLDEPILSGCEPIIGVLNRCLHIPAAPCRFRVFHPGPGIRESQDAPDFTRYLLKNHLPGVPERFLALYGLFFGARTGEAVLIISPARRELLLFRDWLPASVCLHPCAFWPIRSSLISLILRFLTLSYVFLRHNWPQHALTDLRGIFVSPARTCRWLPGEIWFWGDNRRQRWLLSMPGD